MIRDLMPFNDLYVVIGNGFDLECGLPTRYTDFLQFLTSAKNISESVELKYKKLRPEIMKKLSDSDISSWDDVLHSFWFSHFVKASESIRSGWMDLENEIDRVVTIIEQSMTLPGGKLLKMDDAVTINQDEPLRGELSELLVDVPIQFSWRVQDYIEYQITYQELAEKLIDDLDIFISALERYLRDYVLTIEARVTENIETLIHQVERSERRHILSFNYTDSFESILSGCGIKAQYCYIHGKIGNGGKNTMVLGVDEHLTGKEYIPFAPFCKYNQRIFKETDSNYMDWLRFIDEPEVLRRGLTIFGHSLGLSDRNVLKAFIMSRQMETTVFYRRSKTFTRMIGNLTEMIGRDEMIMRNGGNHRTMTFVKQE